VTPLLPLNEGEAGGAGGKLEADADFIGGNSNGGGSPNCANAAGAQTTIAAKKMQIRTLKKRTGISILA
jgi:hypothetical protein